MAIYWLCLRIVEVRRDRKCALSLQERNNKAHRKSLFIIKSPFNRAMLSSRYQCISKTSVMILAQMDYFLSFYRIKPWSSFYALAIESNSVRVPSEWSRLIKRMALGVKKNGIFLPICCKP